MHKVVFVCVGNICRSAAMEAALRHIAKKQGAEDQFCIESRGISSYASGGPRDRDTVIAGKRFGLEITGKARAFSDYDFDQFDHIFAATDDVHHHLKLRAQTPDEKEKVMMATTYCQNHHNATIPSPIGGGDAAFDHVFEIMIEAAETIYAHLMSRSK